MDIQPLDVLKWIGVVLAAGFIGYFGRYLGMLVIERIHKRKSRQIPPAGPAHETPVGQATTPEEAQLKLEKKRAKAEAKKAKKEQKKQD